MKTDLAIKNNVLAELKWQPDIKESEIGVIVKEGIVTLTGTVSKYHQKKIAEKAAKRVVGVKAVADGIKVHCDNHRKTDAEIAMMVVSALEWNASVPKEKIMVVVEDGYIQLTGSVPWHYQRKAAKRTIQNLIGVRGVKNDIQISTTHVPKNMEKQILAALERSAFLEAKRIRVLVDGDVVQLKGRVHSLKEKTEAEKIAYRAPGVKKVKNDIIIQLYPKFM